MTTNVLACILLATFSISGIFFTFPQYALTGMPVYAVAITVTFSIFLLFGVWCGSLNGGLKSTAARGSITQSLGITPLVVLCLFSFLGVFCSVEAVIENQTFTEHMIKTFILGDPDSRVYFELSSEEGGASGIYKLGSHLSLVVLNLITWLRLNGYFFRNLSRELHNLLYVLAVVGVTVKVLLTLDRVTVVFLGLSILLLVEGKIRRLFRLRTLLLVSVLLALANEISAARLSESGLLSSAFLYSRLGLENLELLVASQIRHTIGSETIFTSTIFVLEALNLVTFSPIQYPFVWNPAQSLFGHAYMDFGVFGFVFFLFLGYLCGWLRTRYSSILPGLSYIPLLVSVVSGIGVSWMRGIEFVFVISLSAIFCFFFLRLKI